MAVHVTFDSNRFPFLNSSPPRKRGYLRLHAANIILLATCQLGEITGRGWGYHRVDVVISPDLTCRSEKRDPESFSSTSCYHAFLQWFHLAYSLQIVLHRPCTPFKCFSISFKENAIAVQDATDGDHIVDWTTLDGRRARHGRIRHSGSSGYRELPVLPPVPRYGPV